MASPRGLGVADTLRDSMTNLDVKNLRLEYQRVGASSTLAIEDVSLTVREGEFVSIVGPSGCGKTTLLKVIAGLLTPTSGSIELGGRTMAETSADRAVVFQEASLFPWFSVARNAGYGLECRGLRPKEAIAKAQPYLNLVGLTGFEGHYPYQISGGMQQRANLARALAVDPRVLLMDEPFASLDAQTRELMQAELLRIWDETRKTVLFVTHQINEAVYLSDRVVVLGARPSQVLADISIALPRPRSLDQKRTQPFLDYESEIWDLIKSQGDLIMSGADASGEA